MTQEEREQLITESYRKLLKKICNTVHSTTGCKITTEAVEIVIHQHESVCDDLEKSLGMVGEKQD